MLVLQFDALEYACYTAIVQRARRECRAKQRARALRHDEKERPLVSDNIAGSAGKEKYIGRTERVDEFGNPVADTWHLLGKYSTEPLSNVEAAFDAANINECIVDKWPHIATPPAHLRHIPGIAPAATNVVQLVRRPIDGDPEWRVFAESVSSRYGVLQPREMAKILQPLADKFGGVDTAGALDHGRTIFAGFKAGDGELPDFPQEKIIHYFVVGDQKDGSHATFALYTPVRVVCANTWAMAKGVAEFTVKLPHIETIHTDLAWATDFLIQAQKAQQRTLALFSNLAKSVATREEIESVIFAAYPEPKKPQKAAATEAVDGVFTDEMKSRLKVWEREVKEAERKRAKVHELVKYENDTASHIANTFYNVVNAVAEAEQFTVGPQQNALVVARNSLFKGGAQAQARAFNKSLELAGVGN